jgi:hypothetical protein
MEQIPVLSEEQRRKLLNLLEQAQRRMKAGEAYDYDPSSFKNRLIRIYREGKP